ncbi:hypothetical protein LCGC14_1489310, partial [marine sediment metagenome]
VGDHLQLSSGATANQGIRIRNDGNVGIGTTTPSQKLVVVGDLNATENINALNLPQEGVTATSMYVCWDIDGHLFLNETGCR